MLVEKNWHKLFVYAVKVADSCGAATTRPANVIECTYSAEQQGFVNGHAISTSVGTFATAEECSAHCSGDAACKAYHYSAKKKECGLKNTNKPQDSVLVEKNWHKLFVYAVKVAGSCGASGTTSAATLAPAATTAKPTTMKPACMAQDRQAAFCRAYYQTCTTTGWAPYTDCIKQSSEMAIGVERSLAGNTFSCRESHLRLATEEGGTPGVHCLNASLPGVPGVCREACMPRMITAFGDKIKGYVTGGFLKGSTATTQQACEDECMQDVKCLSFHFSKVRETCGLKNMAAESWNVLTEKPWHRTFGTYNKVTKPASDSGCAEPGATITIDCGNGATKTCLNRTPHCHDYSSKLCNPENGKQASSEANASAHAGFAEATTCIDLMFDVRSAEVATSNGRSPCSVSMPRPSWDVPAVIDVVGQLLPIPQGKGTDYGTYSVGVYSTNGKDAEEVRQKLLAAGYQNVQNLGGWPQNKDHIEDMCNCYDPVTKAASAASRARQAAFCASYTDTCASTGWSLSYPECMHQVQAMAQGSTGTLGGDSFSCRESHLAFAMRSASMQALAYYCPLAAASGGGVCSEPVPSQMGSAQSPAWNQCFDVVYDVRTAAVFESNITSCTGVRSLPLATWATPGMMDTVVRNQIPQATARRWKIGVYGTTGGDSEEARQLLLQAGYDNVQNLGGWNHDQDYIADACGCYGRSSEPANTAYPEAGTGCPDVDRVQAFCSTYTDTCSASAVPYEDCAQYFSTKTFGAAGALAGDSFSCREAHLGLAVRSSGPDGLALNCPKASSDGAHACIAQH